MRHTLILTLGAAALVLAGCGSKSPLQRTLPDETQVLSGPKLTLPPSFELRPPREGEAPPPALARQLPVAQAVSGSAPAEAWLIEQAQTNTGTVADPTIRAQLDALAVEPVKEKTPLQRWFGRDKK